LNAGLLYDSNWCSDVQESVYNCTNIHATGSESYDGRPL